MVGYLIFIGSMALSVICISYEPMARSKGWPIGLVLSKDASVPKLLAIVTAIWILVKSFIVLQWWSPLLILAVGWFLAFLITMALKPRVQYLGILGVFPAFIATVIYVSEARPLGFLHELMS